VFLFDSSLQEAAQGIVVRADAPAAAGVVRFVVDGAVRGVRSAPFEQSISLSVGTHRVWIEADGFGASEAIEYHVL